MGKYEDVLSGAVVVVNEDKLVDVSEVTLVEADLLVADKDELKSVIISFFAIRCCYGRSRDEVDQALSDLVLVVLALVSTADVDAAAVVVDVAAAVVLVVAAGDEVVAVEKEELSAAVVLV